MRAASSQLALEAPTRSSHGFVRGEPILYLSVWFFKNLILFFGFLFSRELISSLVSPFSFTAIIFIPSLLLKMYTFSLLSILFHNL